MSTEPRAYRCRNPGNLRKSEGQIWQGQATAEQMTPEQANEKTFVVFVNFIYGFRALAITLRNYGRLHDLKTVRAIIGRFAPINENDTTAYVRHVCTLTGFDEDVPLNLDNPQTIRGLCRAIAIHECGSWRYSLDDLASGTGMAFHPTDDERAIA